MSALLSTSFILGTLLPSVCSIGCFVCSSINGSEPDCEDTFNNTNKFYYSDCKAGRRERTGVFPATGCIKMKAYNATYKVIVRDCTVDNGDTTSDTEMGRESHCWMVNMVRFNDVDMHGCALACNTDGCNGATSMLATSSLQQLVVTSFVACVATAAAMMLTTAGRQPSFDRRL